MPTGSRNVAAGPLRLATHPTGKAMPIGTVLVVCAEKTSRAIQARRRRAYAAAARPSTRNPFGSGTGAGRIATVLEAAAGPPPIAARAVSPTSTAGNGRFAAAGFGARTEVRSVTRAGANVATTEGIRVELGRPLAAPRESNFGTRGSMEAAAGVAELVVPAGDEAAAVGPEETAAVPATEGPPSAWLSKAIPTAWLMAPDASEAPGTVVPAPAVAGVVGMVAVWACGFTIVAGVAPKFAPAPPFAATVDGLAPTGAEAPAAVAGLPGGGVAAVALPLGMVAPPAISGAVVGAALTAAEAVPPAVAPAMPTVEVAVPEPGVIAVAAAVAEGMLVDPVPMVGGSLVAERSFEAAEPTTADRIGAAAAVVGLADVAGAATEFAMTCAARPTGA